jgi:hypothetical protein
MSKSATKWLTAIVAIVVVALLFVGLIKFLWVILGFALAVVITRSTCKDPVSKSVALVGLTLYALGWLIPGQGTLSTGIPGFGAMLWIGAILGALIHNRNKRKTSSE